MAKIKRVVKDQFNPFLKIQGSNCCKQKFKNQLNFLKKIEDQNINFPFLLFKNS